jgi:hypothetical protein
LCEVPVLPLGLYVTASAKRILHSVISVKFFEPLVNRDVLVSLASKFLAVILTLEVLLVAWKYSSLELDHIACFAGSGVGLDYPGECSWEQRTCPFCSCPGGKVNSQLVGSEEEVVRPFVTLDSLEVECLGTVLVFYLFFGYPYVFVKEK